MNMGRTPCCVVEGLKKGQWKPQEDEKLLAYIQQHGHGSWRSLPQKAGLQRCGKSCRLRWNNYLRPDIKRGNFSLQEERTIIRLHALLGNKWSVIAAHLPKRTDNEIKNYWNTHLRKRLAKMSIDPVTHKPVSTTLDSAKNVSVLSHMAQWESARLEAEGRLSKELQLQLLQHEPAGSSGSTPLPAPAKQLNKLVTKPLAPPRCLDVLKAWQSIMSNPIEGHGGGGGGCFGFDYDYIESPTFTFSGVFGGNMNELFTTHHRNMVFDAGDVWSNRDEDSFEGIAKIRLNNLEKQNLSSTSIFTNDSTAAGSGSNVGDQVQETLNKNYWNDDLLDMVNAGAGLSNNVPVFSTVSANMLD